jgi:hypothetical protein
VVPTERLNVIWEEHLRHEFDTKDADETIKTMVNSLLQALQSFVKSRWISPIRERT